MEQAISAFEGPFSHPVSHRWADQPFGSWGLGTTPLLAARWTSTALFLCPRPEDTPPSTHLLPIPPPWYNFLHVDLHMASALHPPPPPVTVALCFSGKSSSQASVVLKAVTPLSADDSFASPRSPSSAFVRISLLRLLFQSAS
jgi:hypothetical protein